jgi:hypothetical protein
MLIKFKPNRWLRITTRDGKTGRFKGVKTLFSNEWTTTNQLHDNIINQFSLLSGDKVSVYSFVNDVEERFVCVGNFLSPV